MTTRKELRTEEMNKINGGLIRCRKADGQYLFEIWTDTDKGREIKTIKSGVADTADEVWINFDEAQKRALKYAMNHHVDTTLVSCPA